MNVTFEIEGKDYSGVVSEFECGQTYPNMKVFNNLNQDDMIFPGKTKSTLFVSFWPLTREELTFIFDILRKGYVSVKYTNPFWESDITQKMRFDGDIMSSFALLSVDGKNRYTGLELSFIEM